MKFFLFQSSGRPLALMVALVMALVLITPIVLGAPAAGQPDDGCQLRAKEAKDCSLCCAIGGFNKFDSSKFASGKGCACYNDQKELAANERHKPRKP